MGSRKRWWTLFESKGENRMIKLLIKALKENPKVTDWLINEVQTDCSQAFYVLQKPETTRIVKTLEYTVTVYHRFTENDQEYLGSSSFALSHKLPKAELAKKIEEAVFASTFIKNKAYNLVDGIQKRVWREKPYELSPFDAIDKIATTFFSVSKKHVRFNSFEIFHSQTTNHIVNSKGVDLKNCLYKIDVEAIPSYDGDVQKVELYKFYHYKDLDFSIILNDAQKALDDVTTRYQA